MLKSGTRYKVRIDSSAIELRNTILYLKFFAELRNEKLNRSLVTMTEFSTSLSETVAWLSTWSLNQPKSILLSAELETLKKEVLEHEQRFRNFVAKEEVVTQLSRAGDEIVSADGTINTESSMVLQNQLAQLKSLWQENMGMGKSN